MMPKGGPQINSKNNNMQCNSQPAGFHNFSQVSLNQQINSVAINNTSSADFFIPSTKILANVTLKNLPFYEVIDEVLKPVILVADKTISLPKFSADIKEAIFKLKLSHKHATMVAMNRDISVENKYVYQIQMRICLLKPGSTEITDYFPPELNITINNNVCPISPIDPLNILSKITPQPINCTELFKLNPSVINVITVNWNSDAKTFVMGLYLVKKLTSEYLLQELMNKKPRSSESSKNYIIQMTANLDSDLTTTSYYFSLVCPLGKIKIKIPAKSVNCNHLQCFDASTFILMNEKKPTWLCPVCDRPCLYNDLQIDTYFLEVILSPDLPDHCDKIELLADGTWKVYEENKGLVETVVGGHEKLIDTIILSDSDDEEPPKEKDQ